MNDLDAELLTMLQRGVPIAARPFAVIGGEIGLSEQGVIARTQDLLDDGTARRFGAVFDSSSLGYGSTLCAVHIPEEDLERAATVLIPHPGITHCYQREGKPNLWFTMTAPTASLTLEVEKTSDALAPYELINLPAIRKFKIEAVFDVRGQAERDHNPPATQPSPTQKQQIPPLSDDERWVVRGMQGNMPLSPDPFRVLASEAAYEHRDLLALLTRWKSTGILRRVALIMRHRELGFTSNSMCVWLADENKIEEAGSAMARHPEVSHCYQRPAFESFPYNLYAMVHAGSDNELTSIFERLSNETGLKNGRTMTSVREFKKSSPVFFCE